MTGRAVTTALPLSGFDPMRPGSTRRLSPVTTTATRRTSSNGGAAGRDAGRDGGADNAHPDSETITSTTRAPSARVEVIPADVMSAILYIPAGSLCSGTLSPVVSQFEP